MHVSGQAITHLLVEVPKSLKLRLRIAAASQDTTIKLFVREALETAICKVEQES